MILQIVKIPNGLSWDGKERFFTNTIFPNGYETFGDDFTFIELDNDVFILTCEDSTIDGLQFSNIQDQLNYIFNV
jgi:hypothetical protein